MNAVKNAFDAHGKKYPFGASDEYERGYKEALSNVQAELDKEVSCDWEVEIKKLNDKHKCEIMEIKKCFEDKNKNSNEMIHIMSLELAEYKAKWEVIQLIFGGK